MSQKPEQETSMSRRTLVEALIGVQKDNPEEQSERIEWRWDLPEANQFVNLLNDKKDVKFHKNFSSGTAVIRGSQAMSRDQYFWELKMISPVYGTDMMVGVGTSEADMSQVHDKFISLLGNDKHTWGLSYTGNFYHNGDSRPYSVRFGQGSVIGVHLDLWNGTLSYYKNKKHLGIASHGLTGKTYYAMASSTAACSGMRIIRSCSFPSSLQYLCCKRLRDLIPDDKHVLRSVEMAPGLRQFLANNLNWLMDCRQAEYTAPPGNKKAGLAYALKPGSTDPLLTNASFSGDESDDDSGDDSPPVDNVVVIGNRPFVLQSARHYMRDHRARMRGDPRVRPMSLVQEACALLRVMGVPQMRRAPLVPQASTLLPEMSTLVPETSTLVPKTSTLVPETSASVPATSTLVPEMITLVPETSTLVSETSTLVPETSTLVPERTFEMADVLDEDEGVMERAAKRRRSSYNYAMGLSDVESDFGAA